jgi:hypothetical protein
MAVAMQVNQRNSAEFLKLRHRKLYQIEPVICLAQLKPTFKGDPTQDFGLEFR